MRAQYFCNSPLAGVLGGASTCLTDYLKIRTGPATSTSLKTFLNSATPPLCKMKIVISRKLKEGRFIL